MRCLKSVLISVVLMVALVGLIGCKQGMKPEKQMTPATHPTSTTP